MVFKRSFAESNAPVRAAFVLALAVALSSVVAAAAEGPFLPNSRPLQ